MALPNSFQQSGFVHPSNTRQKVKLPKGGYLKPLLIGSDGGSDTGKSEFAFSCPGPIQALCIDRNFSGVFDNPEPPPARAENIGIKVVAVPLEGYATQAEFQTYHNNIKTDFYGMLANTDSLTAVVDGDSDWYEVMTLAMFGKTKQIFPQTRWGDLYVHKRALLARAFDAGKIVVFTNKVQQEYKVVYNEDGSVAMDNDTGQPKKAPTGRMVTQGFKDQDYLYQIWLRHLYEPAGVVKVKVKGVDKEVEKPQRWGIRITKCKHNMSLIGSELWGDECCFRGLVEFAFPDVPLSRWGL